VILSGFVEFPSESLSCLRIHSKCNKQWISQGNDGKSNFVNSDEMDNFLGSFAFLFDNTFHWAKYLGEGELREREREIHVQITNTTKVFFAFPK